MTRILIFLTLVFALGWLSHTLYSDILVHKEFPFISAGSIERASPQDIISKNDISIDQDKIIIKIKDASLSSYADTNSMDPLLDKGANGIEIVPKCSSLKPGDVIAYQLNDDLIIHRILEIKEDNQGRFFRMKGDNNVRVDPEKVRCDQVKYQLVGVLY